MCSNIRALRAGLRHHRSVDTMLCAVVWYLYISTMHDRIRDTSLTLMQYLSHEADSGSFSGRVASGSLLLAFALARSDREGCSLLARLGSAIKSREKVLEYLPVRI